MIERSSFESLLQGEFRWPRRGDRAFTQSPRWEENACIDPHGHGRLVMMMSGYKKAADLMVTAAADRGDRDALVYPIIFNYRHFIELSLKYLIATYGHTVGVDPMWKSHDLRALWQSFAAMLERYGQDMGEEANTAVAAVVAEFSKMDPGSFSYRYPVDTKGHPIPIGHDELDITVLADVMEALDGYFSGCDGYLEDLQSATPYHS